MLFAFLHEHFFLMPPCEGAATPNDRTPEKKVFLSL
jgi:hypothetical protein